MSSLNKVILIGRVGKVDVVSLGADRELVKVSLATSESYKNKDGDWVEKTEWHHCVSTIPGIVRAMKTWQKGDIVSVDGSIETNNFKKKDGTEVNDKQIKVYQGKKIVNGPNREPNQNSGSNRSAPQPQSNQAQNDNPFGGIDDLPI